jgi:hypothetical protein
MEVSQPTAAETCSLQAIRRGLVDHQPVLWIRLMQKVAK